MAEQQLDLLMGAEAIAAFLGIKRRVVYNLIYAGEIPAFKVQGTVAARKSALASWLDNKAVA